MCKETALTHPRELRKHCANPPEDVCVRWPPQMLGAQGMSWRVRNSSLTVLSNSSLSCCNHVYPTPVVVVGVVHVVPRPFLVMDQMARVLFDLGSTFYFFFESFAVEIRDGLARLVLVSM